MRYVEVAFTVAKDRADVLGDLLVEAGATGIEERDASTLFSADAGEVTLVVWVEEGKDAEFVRAVETGRAGALAGVKVESRARDEEEWRDAWKRYFSSRRIGKFVIVPSWESYTPGGDEIVLDLDPGRAFGTGGHASTRLCLEVLSRLPKRTRVLDVGCGSGVLAIAAARAWPEATGMGVDIDPDAVEVSCENAQRNGVLDRLRFSTERPKTIDGCFDLVTANIQPEILIPMSGDLSAKLTRDGRLVLAGILVEASPPVEAVYGALGLELAESIDEEGWRALVYKRS